MSLVTTEKKDNNIVELEIAVGAEELSEATQRVFRRKSKSITVPGFRKGKAPRQIIERMYGEGIFLEDAVNDLYPSAYSTAVEEAGIEPVDKADIEILTLDKQTGFTFKAVVTVKPEVTVKNYKGIKAEKKVAEAAESNVDAEVERMRERGARIITVEDRAAQSGDTAIIDFKGFVDEKPFEGGEGQDFSLVLGSGSFIDNFEDQIVGHKTGDSFDVNVTFPEEYHAEELKGKPALFQVTVKELKTKELPALDDEFVKDVSEFDVLDDLKNDIRQKLQEALDKQADTDLENALIDQVIAGLEGDIPACMYENKIDELVRDFEYRLSAQRMNLQLYLQYTGMDEENFRKTFREQAERQVKIRLALEKIAEEEKIEVSPEEIEAEYAKQAESYEIELEKLKGFLPEKDLVADLKAGKAIDLVRDSAKVKEVKEKKEAEAAKPKASKAKKEAAGDKSAESPKKSKKATEAAGADAEQAAAQEAPAAKPAAKKPSTKKAAPKAKKEEE